MKKRFILAAVCGMMIGVLGLTGCSSNAENNKEEKTETMKETKTSANGAKTEKETDVVKVETSEINVPNGENSVYGKLYSPGEGKHPAIIMCHGYNGCNADWTNECYYFVKNGYVAVAIDFCGGSVKSKSTGKTTDMTITSEKSDLLAVYHYVSGLDNVDPDHIFLMGGSQGGLVSTLATEELQDKVAGLMLYFPALCVFDNWTEKYASADSAEDVIPFWGMDLGKGFVQDVYGRDIFSEIGTYKGDVLIIHGDQDAIVPLSYSEKAKELYASAELVVLPGEGHGFSPKGAETAKEKLFEFMEAHVK